MKHPIRLVGLDLDGTVFNDDKQITPRTKRAIRLACAAGVAVLPVTGRPRLGLPQELMDIPGVRYAITSNGGAVQDVLENRSLASYPMEKQDVLLALQLGEPFHALSDVYVDGAAYTLENRFSALVDAAPANMKAYFLATRRKVDSFEAWLAKETRDIEKVTMLFENPQDRLAAMEAMHAAGRFEVSSSIPGNMELNANGIDKGRALLELARQLGIPRESVMACGDSSNDLAMLRAAGLGVAMGNATAQAQAAADVMTASNNDDGVAHAIEQYVLNEVKQ